MEEMSRGQATGNQSASAHGNKVGRLESGSPSQRPEGTWSTRVPARVLGSQALAVCVGVPLEDTAKIWCVCSPELDRFYSSAFRGWGGTFLSWLPCTLAVAGLLAPPPS